MDMHSTKIRQVGSMLLEALISILIFSLGILAVVGLQATALDTASDSTYRSAAGSYANAMVGTIWATRIGPLVPNASNVMAGTPDPSFQATCAAASSPACVFPTPGPGVAYTGTWFASGVETALPLATASISLASSPAVTITIGWKAPQDAFGHQYTVQTYVQ